MKEKKIINILGHKVPENQLKTSLKDVIKKRGMEGILVIDNTVLGPGCGGIRISPTITPRLVFEQARKMTLTCGLVDLNFGGAAAGIRVSMVAFA